jgi:sigma-B regulation protein RsbU (phosphoserine phosphatase)
MRSFRAWLVLFGGGLAVVSVLLTTAIQTWQARAELIRAAEADGAQIGRLLGHSAWATQQADAAGTALSVHNLLDVLLVGESIRAVWILDERRNMVAVGYGTMSRAILDAHDYTSAAQALTGQTVSYFTGESLTVVTPAYPPDGGDAWAVVLRVDRAELDRSLRGKLISGASLFLVVAAIAFAMMSRIAHWLARPVQAVADAAAAVETKRFDPGMLEAVAARRDEFGGLAKVFTRMAQEVLSREEVLESKVRERTRELAEKNEELETANARIAEELQITQRMQISILPTEALEADGARVFARMVPAREVGGDFYDFMRIDDDRIAVVIGDVSGKGVPAAFFMAVARTVLRRLALAGNAPGAVLASANDELCEVNPLEMFVTAFVGILDRRDGSFVYANAGHNPPCLISRDRQVTFLERTGGMALGVMPKLPQGERSITVAPGEVVFLYTDGVTEAFDAEGTQFDEQRMLDVLKERLAGETLVERMIGAVERFSDGAERSDDVTVLALDRTASAAGTPADDATVLEVTAANRIDALQDLAAAVGAFAEANGLAMRDAMHLDLAVEEIASNVIKYGFEPGDAREDAITLSLSLSGDALAIRISDHGRPFDPLADAPMPDVDADMEDRPIGGLGVHLVKTVMTDLRYTRADDRNVLDMVLTLNRQT